MMDPLQSIDLAQWDQRYADLCQAGVTLPDYCAPLSQYMREGDTRLQSLTYDPDPAALRLWCFLLSEEERLHQAWADGHLIVGAMKDLGTVPVMAYSLDKVTAFYPDGAWWIPCVMELGAGLLEVADDLGVDESFCPVRAMLGAFVTKNHFPIPDLLISSAGAVCDDFSAIAQRLEGMGYPILWWECPHRRTPDPNEEAVTLPAGFVAPGRQVAAVRAELERVRGVLEERSGQRLDDEHLRAGIQRANRVRTLLNQLRDLAYGSPICPLLGLEMLIAEMLAIHFCSDQDESLAVLAGLVGLAEQRVAVGQGYGNEQTVRIFWVNPVADLRVMNLLEQCGARICGTEYLFSHALDPIPEDLDPMEALARMALADPMVGSSRDRADRVCHDIERFGAQAVVVSRIPGASHCAWEGRVIAKVVQERLGLPVLEIEVPPLTDALIPALQTRLEALVETIKQNNCDL